MRILSVFSLISLFGLSACLGSSGPARVTYYGASQGPGSAGVHNVERGDTLWVISQRYNIVMRDIVLENRLQPPYKLYPGQRVILPPPREYRVRRGDSVSGVARLFDASASEIVRINDLQSPYRLRVGQILRLPSPVLPVKKPVTNEPVVARVEPPARIERVVPKAKPVEVSKSGIPKPPKKPAVSETPKKSIVKKRVGTPARASSKFLKPVNGKIISGYGSKENGLYNDGINIQAARGSSVKAAENGVVVYAGDGLKESGNLILVRHADRWMTAYGHLGSIKVANGATVSRGQAIGTVGSTGAVKSPQLHFEIRRGTKALNPKPYLE